MGPGAVLTVVEQIEKVAATTAKQVHCQRTESGLDLYVPYSLDTLDIRRCPVSKWWHPSGGGVAVGGAGPSRPTIPATTVLGVLAYQVC